MQSAGLLVTVIALAALLLDFAYYGAALYPTAHLSAPAVAAGSAAAAPIWQTRTYRIGGMTCEACARHVEHAVQQVPKVQTVALSYDQATAPALAGHQRHWLPHSKPNPLTAAS